MFSFLLTIIALYIYLELYNLQGVFTCYLVDSFPEVSFTFYTRRGLKGAGGLSDNRAKMQSQKSFGGPMLTSHEIFQTSPRKLRV